MATPVFAGALAAIVPIVSRTEMELRIELCGDEEPIQGHLIDAQGTRIDFAGWTQLVSLIEQARGNRDRSATDGHGHLRTSTLDRPGGSS